MSRPNGSGHLSSIPRMRFGVFIPPFHAPAGQNPTLAYERDLAMVRLLDDLGYDEAWIGEHHSGGVETITDPVVFIAYAAAQTRHIRLGPGVITLPYHNPLWVADRMLLLDHLTRGRVMLGLGSGSLPSDALMIGIDVAETRHALDADVDVLMHLLQGTGPVSAETSRYKLVDAQTHVGPYSDPLFEVAVTGVVSPSGPRLAGRHGLGLISIGATTPAGFDALKDHWSHVEEQAAASARVADRRGWRLVGPMHLAPTREQAVEEVRFGLEPLLDYLQATLPAAVPEALFADALRGRHEERVERFCASGFAVIGTPADAIAQIERLQAQTGGFGCYLIMATEMADPEATARSYELFARHVFPHFKRSAAREVASHQAVRARRTELSERRVAATEAYIKEAESERRVPPS